MTTCSAGAPLPSRDSMNSAAAIAVPIRRSPAIEVANLIRVFDVVPASPGKGWPLKWLCQRLGISLDQVLVAGDSGNDADMFRLPGVNGILVGNALAELSGAVSATNMFRASREMADGVMEGLRHFGIIPEACADVSIHPFSCNPAAPPCCLP